MSANDELIEAYLGECAEHLDTCESSLLSLEQDNQNDEIINSLFRAVHSIKGGAGFFGLDHISSLAHVMENLMNMARNKEVNLESSHLDALFKGLDKLKLMMDDVSKVIDASEEVANIEKFLATSYTEKVELEGKSFNTQDAYFQKFELNESDVKNAINQQMEIYAVKAFLKKDILEKNKTPMTYIENLEKLGSFISSYLDIDSAPSIDDAIDNEIPFVFLFASILGDDLICDALDVDQSQVVHIDVNQLKDEVKVKDKSGIVTDVKQLADEVKQPPIQAEPVAAAKTTANDKDKPSKPGSSIQVAETIRVKVSQLNQLVNLAGELVLARNQLLRIAEEHVKDITGFPAILQNINTIASELQEEIMNTRMQPISIIFNKFSRVIHDLAKQLNKKMALKIEGGSVELDKTIIELLSDPLNHIIRNSADHGLETTEDRIKSGKHDTGHITLKAYHLGGMVNIDVVDDGNGIDPVKVTQKALEKGIITREEAKTMTDKEKVNLVFAPGFSTAEAVSDVSGRGVGMDVVNTNIKKLGGMVEIESFPGKGTSVHMTLPLTLAIVSSLIIETENERFAIPQVNIEEIVRVKVDEFNERLARVRDGDVLKLRGELLPLVHLARGVGISKTYIDPDTGTSKEDRREKVAAKDLEKHPEVDKWDKERNQNEPLRILVVRLGNNKFGIIVDEVLGSEEIVVKPMPEYLRHMSWYSGSTILGDGKVSLILDIPGFSTKNDIKFSDSTSVSKSLDGSDGYSSGDEKQEFVELLIFNNGTKEQFAIPIPLIQRVDETNVSKVERIGDDEFIDYNGKSMKLIHIEDQLPIQKPEKSDNDIITMIIPKTTKRPAAIIIKHVVDTKSINLILEKNTIAHDSILGSTIIDGKITLLLDIHGLCYTQAERDNVNATHTAKNKKILLVEDTPFFRKIESDYLTSFGYNVQTASDGEKALEIMSKEKFDAIVTDIEMPNMNGIEFVSELRGIEQFKTIPVIALTSVADPTTKSRSKEMGFNSWLQKMNKNELLDELTRLL